MNFLKSIPYTILIPFAIGLALAPFTPEPHLVEKIRMLAHGELRRPIDIIDLAMHAAPAILLLLKIIVQGRGGASDDRQR